MEEEGPFHVLRELLAVKFGRSRDDPHSIHSTKLVEIEEQIDSIMKAFQEILDCKKQRENECEEIIQYLNKFDPTSTPDSSGYRDQLAIDVHTKVEHIVLEMANYLPKVFGPRRGSLAAEEVLDTGNMTQMPYREEDQEGSITRQLFDGLEDEKLKLCFLTLSIFPEGCVLKKRDIILGWVCDGLLEPTREDRAAEEVGEEYFAKLLDSGLICPVYNRGSEAVKGCRLPSYVRSMAITIAIGRDMSSFGFNSRVVLQGGEEAAISCPLNVSHIFNFDVTRVNMDNLFLSLLKNIRVLRIGSVQNFCRNDHWTVVNPHVLLKCLVHLKKLRYLGLQGLSGVKELPPNIDLLSELVVMDLQACHDLEKLPSKLSHLGNLTHLNVWRCHLLRSIPLGGKILKLEVLKGLVLGNSVDAGLTFISGSNIEWKNLRKLNIYFKNKTEVSQHELFGIKNLKSLRAITISCGLFRSRSRSLPLSYLDMNWLPEDIEKLDLRCFPLEGTPPGLLPSKLKKLKRLYLRGGNLQSLDALAKEEDKVWQVEVLRLRHLSKLKLDAPLIRRGFPCLKYVEIQNCPNTYNWPGNKWNLKICDALEMYSGLEEMEKLCFLYLSIFPEGFVISERNLSYWWIGEGIIGSLENGKYSMQQCLKKLVECNLIEIIYKQAQEKTVGLTLHPSIRQVAVNLAIEKQFLMPDFESNTTKLIQYSLDNTGDSFSLFNVNLRCVKLEDIVPYFSSLTALQLGSWKSSEENAVKILDPTILENLQHLKRLRYLSLQGTSGVTRIPNSIDGLLDLRVLDLKGCRDLKTLPDSVANVRQLKVLDVSECSKLQEVPSQLLELQTLEVLKGLLVTSGLKIRRPSMLSRIFSLEQNHGSLTKLTINIRSDKVFLENGLSELSSLVSLLSLTITWEINTTMNFASKDVSWWPPCLRKLNLRCYPLEAPPKVAPETLLCLKKIGFRGGNLRTLSGLAKTGFLQGVERLILHDLKDLQMDWSEVRHLFPSLIYAEVIQCPKVRSFPNDLHGVWKTNQNRRRYL